MDAPDRSAAIQACANSAAVTPPTRSVRAGGVTGVRRAPSCAACPVGMWPGQTGMRLMNSHGCASPQGKSGIRGQPVAGRSGITCSADLQGRQTPRGGDGLKAGPLERKHSAQASGMDAHWGETPSVARCAAARQRDPASPGDARTSVEPAMRFYPKPQKHETTFTHLRKPMEPYIRQYDFAPMHESASTPPRHTVQAQTQPCENQVRRKTAQT